MKSINTIKMVYDLRFEMYRAIYNHKRAQAIELMIRDILVKADPYFNFLETLSKPEKYTNLTDLIIKRIERSNEPILKESQQII